MNSKAGGLIGEELAAQFLKRKGYKILERNAEYSGVEVDIIALYKKTRVFCEVKTRSDARFGTPAEAVNGFKIARYARAAKGYVVKNRLTNTDIRFDVIEVLDGEVYHLENAFDMSDAKGYYGRR